MVVVEDHQEREPSMGEITTIGVDVAKHVFQLHGVDAAGEVVLRRRLRRSQIAVFFSSLRPCLIGMEACGTGHFWAREIAGFGHDVRLMPPGYVKPYVKRNKHDAADAEAVCEALRRPSMRFVPVKTPEQQAALVAHGVRDLLVRQRTMLVNAMRGHLAEFGIIAPRGIHKVEELIAVIGDASEQRIPASARRTLRVLATELAALDLRIAALEAEIVTRTRMDPVARRLTTIPGVGPIIASRITATVPDPSVFRSGRDFAAWIGLVPRQNSTGGKVRLGGISKSGNGTLRSLLVGGAMAAMFRTKALQNDAWLLQLRARKPVKVAAVALARACSG
ncbi:MAG TPA: IS110 family transposase [Bryobacteraceae bacterium]|nr:IS110 family transposase [Bryobacteraceae bacterium]